jgi:L-aspartate oxidase
MHEMTYDAIIVGSGIAGLRAAIEIGSAGGRVAILTKDGPTDSSSDKAQGGLAAVLSDDDEVELHYQDTLVAGDGLCSEGAVQVLVEEGPARAVELIEWGARFDREGARLALTREGAHSKRRILHADGDSTGREIVRALVEKARATRGIVLLPQMFTIDLVLRGGRCSGLLAIDERTSRQTALAAPAVLLATGGAGQVYRETTNPPQATGDGMAMAYRAGAEMMDLEFVQFHPTALSLPGAPRFLLSEAMRGEGGRLVNARGEPFMMKHDPRGDLAPRDVVARGIVAEIKETGGSTVFLEMTHLDAATVRGRFPSIAATCARFGLDIARDRIPVTPAAHYFMGGVKTDLWGRTSVVGLYAAGEAACNGVHGANRLASNSLLEGLVFGARAGRAAQGDRMPAAPAIDPFEGIPEIRSIAPAEVPETLRVLRAVMGDQVGILRDEQGLERAVGTILRLELGLGPRPASREGLEARNLLFVGRLIAESALARRESRGSHHRIDHPRKEPGRARHSIIAPGAPAPDLPRQPPAVAP